MIITKSYFLYIFVDAWNSTLGPYMMIITREINLWKQSQMFSICITINIPESILSNMIVLVNNHQDLFALECIDLRHNTRISRLEKWFQFSSPHQKQTNINNRYIKSRIYIRSSLCLFSDVITNRPVSDHCWIQHGAIINWRLNCFLFWFICFLRFWSANQQIV